MYLKANRKYLPSLLLIIFLLGPTLVEASLMQCRKSLLSSYPSRSQALEGSQELSPTHFGLLEQKREWKLYWSQVFVSEIKKAASETLMVFTLLHGAASTDQLLNEFERGYHEAVEQQRNQPLTPPRLALDNLQRALNEQEFKMKSLQLISAMELIEEKTSRPPNATEVKFLRNSLFKDQIATPANDRLDEEIIKNYQTRNIQNIVNLLKQKENLNHE